MSLDLDRSTWRRVKFGDVVRNVNENVKDPEAAGIDRVIGLEHLDPCELRIDRWGDLTEETTFTRRVKPGQTLFGKRRAYQRKTAYAEFDAVCSGDILVFESADPAVLLPELLPFIAMTDGFYAKALETSAGSLSPRTRWSDLATYEFELPPLVDQRRIADLLWSIEQHLLAIDAQLESAVGAVTSLRNRLMERESAGAACSLRELEERGVVELGRGKVISQKTMKASPGPYPVYSSSQQNDGCIGTYASYDFDEALITWSIDGGGKPFFRAKHKFSVTNVGGFMRIVDPSQMNYEFLFEVVDWQWDRCRFDWQDKAHPSVIRDKYNHFPDIALPQQQAIARQIASVRIVGDSVRREGETVRSLRQQVLAACFAHYSGSQEQP